MGIPEEILIPVRQVIQTIDLEFQGVPGLIASYLIEADDGLIVVEPGPGSTRETHLRKLGELGVDPGDVCAVFVTHAHLDHCGAGGWWAARGATLYCHPKAARHLIDPTRLVESARGVYGDLFDSLWGEMLPAPEERVRILEDGERVSIGGIEIEAVNTPGHAFHHHAYALGTTIFSGDVAGLRLTGEDYISVTAAPPQFHLSSYLQSIDSLRARPIDRLMLTHFGEVTDVDAHLARYRAAVESVAEFVRPMVEAAAPAEEIRTAYGENQKQAAGLTDEAWQRYQLANSTAMCADGLRLSWERELGQG